MSREALVRVLTWRMEDAVRELVPPNEQARALEALAESLRWRAELARKRRAKGGA